MMFVTWKNLPMKPDWTIRETDANWECDWEGSERFQLRYFKSLSLTEKVKAVEQMCKTARYFAHKAAQRRTHVPPAR